jgi:hypothetical protein
MDLCELLENVIAVLSVCMGDSGRLVVQKMKVCYFMVKICRFQFLCNSFLSAFITAVVGPNVPVEWTGLCLVFWLSGVRILAGVFLSRRVYEI